jgi:hypothetical protein
MLTYALVVERGSRLGPGVLALLRDVAAPAVPFVAQRHVVWSDPAGAITFAGWESTGDDDPVGSRWAADEAGLTAFSGHTWPRARPWAAGRPWAEQLADHLRAHPLRDGTDDLLGVFTAVSIDHHGRGAVAGDALGLALVYRAQHGDTTVLSSRASVAAAVLGAATGAPPRRDTWSTGFLAFSGRSMGPGTGYVGVEALPVGAVVVVDPGHAPRVERRSARPWRLSGDAAPSPEEVLAGVRSDITTSLEAALAMPVEHHILNLTGGKDSRTILAAALNAGLAEAFEYQTWGAEDLPDVVIARQISDQLGLPHVVNAATPLGAQWRADRDAALAATGHVALGRRELNLRLTVGSHLGMLNAIDPQVSCPPHGDRTVVSGLTGELLRANYPSAGRLRTVEDVERFLFVGLRFGVAGILRADVRSAYEDALWQMVFEDTTGDEVPDVLQAFFLRQWLRRWFAVLQEVDELDRVFPLYSPFGIRAMFEMGPAVRHSEWLHHQLTRSASARLADLPFTKAGWPPEVEPAPRARRPAQGRPPVPGRPATRPPAPFGGSGAPTDRTVKRDQRAAQEEGDVAVMRRFLLDDSSNPLQELLDPRGVATALDRFGELNGRAKLQLYGALSAAIWLGGEELCYGPGTADVPPRIGPAT